MLAPPADRISDPALLVLTSLAEGPKHGYAIMADILAFAGVKLGPGTLYGTIQRLEERKLLQPVQSDDRRQPYELTPDGQRHIREQLRMLQSVTQLGFQRLEAL